MSLLVPANATAAVFSCTALAQCPSYFRGKWILDDMIEQKVSNHTQELTLFRMLNTSEIQNISYVRCSFECNGQHNDSAVATLLLLHGKLQQ